MRLVAHAPVHGEVARVELFGPVKVPVEEERAVSPRLELAREVVPACTARDNDVKDVGRVAAEGVRRCLAQVDPNLFFFFGKGELLFRAGSTPSPRSLLA